MYKFTQGILKLTVYKVVRMLRPSLSISILIHIIYKDFNFKFQIMLQPKEPRCLLDRKAVVSGLSSGLG